MGRRDQEALRSIPEIFGSVLRDGDDSGAAFQFADGLERRERHRVANLFGSADYGSANARRGRGGFATSRNIPGPRGERSAEGSRAVEEYREDGYVFDSAAKSPSGGVVRRTGHIERP